MRMSSAVLVSFVRVAVTAPLAAGAGARQSSPIAIAADNRAFVANALDGTVSVVDLVTREIVNTYPVGVEPPRCCRSRWPGLRGTGSRANGRHQ